MSPELIAVLAVIAVALAFDYTNGFHDAANAIATSVSTRALTPRVALALAAVGNFVGAHFGAGVAKTVGDNLVTLPTGIASLGVVFAGVLGAIAWNLITWYFGLPSSSSHALFGGLVGATLLATGGVVQWINIGEKVLLPMVLSPIVGLTLGYLLMLAILWLFRNGQPGKLNRGFRWAQTASAAAMSVGHGMQDAAKTMGIVVLALYTGGFQDDKTHIPGWVFWTSAAMLAAGTYAGGWRIIRTLGRKIIDLGPPEGFAAETVASSVLYFNALVLHAPISTTHTITSAIMGVGATKRLSAVRWNVAGNIVVAWIITFPAAALIACVTYLLVRPLFG
ncbi:MULTISPECIES: inorganic phosphate transporter [Micromonospora]|uniref:Inorganic phosphate transporter n=1 Tax=Micromonospora carbonacea TaxID=47853 RepID=A0A1C4U4R0_9ACTN|nr:MULTISPECIES: inorganic phosphate transporter [Micromonospora]MBB5824061.1 PiT family inorganic phosphate transporter [Micromonospora carbonacea]MDG4815706.1 inorganic phosphate transporter [Micromonospora sp. WMMD956]QLD27692.1 inorganic phosphate transporter [Micromonospora carbonacea]WFE58261.1 inorganic phosphate transporter [Micromonospora sp. WMMD712]SCE66662.1 inorganic phosphate transporter, PiT family [Micromonospora carbonacea]